MVQAWAVGGGCVAARLHLGQLPAIGAIFGKPEKVHPRTAQAVHLSESGDLYAIGGWVGAYARLVTSAVRHPFLVLALVGLGLAGITAGLFTFGKGVEFFVEQDTNDASLFIRARGNLSADEKRDLVIEVEKRVLGAEGLHSVYTVSGITPSGSGAAPVDTIGRIFMELKPLRSVGRRSRCGSPFATGSKTCPGCRSSFSSRKAGRPPARRSRSRSGQRTISGLKK